MKKTFALSTNRKQRRCRFVFHLSKHTTTSTTKNISPLMKRILFAAFVAIPSIAMAQQCRISTSMLGNQLCFALPGEANVREYRVEGGNDTAAMQLIAVQPACKANRPAPVRYQVALPVGGAPYRYYRVVRVSMDQSWAAGPVIDAGANTSAAPVLAKDGR